MLARRLGRQAVLLATGTAHANGALANLATSQLVQASSLSGFGAALQCLSSAGLSLSAQLALRAASSQARTAGSLLAAQELRQCSQAARQFSSAASHEARNAGSLLASQQQHGLRPHAARQLSTAAQSSRQPSLLSSQQKKSGEQGLYIIAFVVAMVGVTYASVPLYRMFCQATGYGGTVQQGEAVEAKLKKQAEAPNAALAEAVASRDITVSFNADVSDGLPWKFVPCQRSVTLRAGQSTLVFYNAHNQGDTSITGVSTYNVAPQQAGQYFNKIQCFCFEEQRLRAHEKIDMPVFFYIDPEFALDPYMKNINHLTLSYTFFKSDSEEPPDEEDDGRPSVVKTHECIEGTA